jgi:hypothetical protein
MAENLDILNTAVSLLVRAVLLAARFLGRVRRRSLKRLDSWDADVKAIRFLRSSGCGIGLDRRRADLQSGREAVVAHSLGERPRASGLREL